MFGMQKNGQTGIRRFYLLLVALAVPIAIPLALPQISLAKDVAGPSFSGGETSKGAHGKGGNASNGGYAGSGAYASNGGYAPVGGYSNSNGMQTSNFNQSGAVGFDRGHASNGSFSNGGNNGSQSAIKLPAANCCGKMTRNSSYYQNDYAGGYNAFGNGMGSSPGGNMSNASNSAQYAGTASGGAYFGGGNNSGVSNPYLNSNSNPYPNQNSNPNLNARNMMQMQGAGSRGQSVAVPGLNQ